MKYFKVANFDVGFFDGAAIESIETLAVRTHQIATDPMMVQYGFFLVINTATEEDFKKYNAGGEPELTIEENKILDKLFAKLETMEKKW